MLTPTISLSRMFITLMPTGPVQPHTAPASNGASSADGAAQQPAAGTSGKAAGDKAAAQPAVTAAAIVASAEATAVMSS